MTDMLDEYVDPEGLEPYTYIPFTEAVFKNGKEKIKPIQDIFLQLKIKLQTMINEQDAERRSRPDSKAKDFNPDKFWRDPLWKELEDKLRDIFGFRVVIVEPLQEKWYSKTKMFETYILNAYVYSMDRFPIEGLVTENGFYDKSHSVQMDITLSLGLIEYMKADEITAFLLHEFGHGIDPALVDIKYSEVNVLSKYMTDRKNKINKSEQKAMQKRGLTIGKTIVRLISTIPDMIKGFFNRSYDKKLEKIKETVKNDKRFTRQEFAEAYADNFARMYGYGPELMRGMNKLARFDDAFVQNRYEREKDRQKIILEITKDMLQDEHKTDVQRAHALLKEYKADLADPDIPEAVKKQIKEDMEELEAVIKAYTEDFSDAQNRMNKAILDALNEMDEADEKKSQKADKDKPVSESVDYINEAVKKNSPRDRRKPADYWDSYIEYQNKRISRSKDKLANGGSSSLYMHLFDYQRDLVSAMFSAGYSKAAINKIFAEACDSYSKLKSGTYDDEVTLVSLAIILNNKSAFNKVYRAFRSDYQADKVLSGLSSYIITGKAEWTGKDPKFLPYKKLSAVIASPSADALSKYVSGWYRASKDAAWYDSHKKDTNTYAGYWAWEAAAISKALNIDDSSVTSSEYYPIL